MHCHAATVNACMLETGRESGGARGFFSASAFLPPPPPEPGFLTRATRGPGHARPLRFRPAFRTARAAERMQPSMTPSALVPVPQHFAATEQRPGPEIWTYRRQIGGNGETDPRTKPAPGPRPQPRGTNSCAASASAAAVPREHHHRACGDEEACHPRRSAAGVSPPPTEASSPSAGLREAACLPARGFLACASTLPQRGTNSCAVPRIEITVRTN
jgi:hypothetical protein